MNAKKIVLTIAAIAILAITIPVSAATKFTYRDNGYKISLPLVSGGGTGVVKSNGAYIVCDSGSHGECDFGVLYNGYYYRILDNMMGDTMDFFPNWDYLKDAKFNPSKMTITYRNFDGRLITVKITNYPKFKATLK